MSKKVILVTGATGRQGTALIASTTSANDSQEQFHVLALTRNPSSPAAIALSKWKNTTVVAGNLDDTSSIRKIFDEYKTNGSGGIWGVFCVLQYPGLGANADGEEKQGKLLADLALEYGVEAFVFSSAERGGERDDDKAALDRLAKVKIERHIKGLGEKGLPWTILRPTFFMENYEGFIGSITVSVLKAGLGPNTTVQMIAVDDIGRVAAGVFKDPAQFKNEILLLCGERSTIQSQDAAYKMATGRPLPSIPNFLARLLIMLNRHTKDLLADMERVHRIVSSPDDNERWDGQVSAAKKAHPGMMTFETWARQKRTGKGGQRGQIDDNVPRQGRWNGVSLWRLLTGKL